MLVPMRCSPPRGARSPHSAPRRRGGPSPLGLQGLAALLVLAPAAAWATPGLPTRLGGIEAQGAGTRSITALHHNPAMLAGLEGNRLHFQIASGVDQRWVRPYLDDPSLGTPTAALGERVALTNPTADWFFGIHGSFEPVSLAFGIYSLGNQYALYSRQALADEVAVDPEYATGGAEAAVTGGCPGLLGACPPNGGAATLRHDVTAAIAYELGNVLFGVAVHLPLLSRRFAYEENTALDDGAPGATDICADPASGCRELVAFRGTNRWFTVRDRGSSFDLALAFGVATTLPNDRITLGMRYRTRPLRRQGTLVLQGEGVVCRLDADGVALPCDDSSGVEATLTEPVPRELAVGGAFELGPAKLWRIDANLTWFDLCPGGFVSCADEGAHTLRFVGLDRDAYTLPEARRYRGARDVFAVDVWATAKPQRVQWTGAIHLRTPAVRPSAATLEQPDTWKLGLSGGAAWRVPGRNLVLAGGYGLDATLPTFVPPSEASYDPGAARDFAASGGDLNGPGADEVLSGLGRPSNAANRFGLVHTLSFAVRWADKRGWRWLD
jgi:hypothetical protein